jgi:hypothetical protein
MAAGRVGGVSRGAAGRDGADAGAATGLDGGGAGRAVAAGGGVGLAPVAGLGVLAAFAAFGWVGEKQAGQISASTSFLQFRQ